MSRRVLAAVTSAALVLAMVTLPASSASAAEVLGGAVDSVLAQQPQVTPGALGASGLTGLQFADPLQQMDLMQPPSASNQGSASIDYPLAIPAGRAGVQPDLSLSYDSGNGNGWLGVGWDLGVGDVSVDTSFGVPRYDSAKETETYRLDGDLLSPTAVRSTFADRVTDRADWTRRVDTARERITRHGNSPKNYWWEVEDQLGNHRYYGAEPTAAGITPVPEAILKDDHDNGYRWGLTAQTDVSGNVVRYRYQTVDGTNVGDGKATVGRQMYLSRITYTGSLVAGNGDDPAYEIVLARKSTRPDVVVSGRGGFLEVTSQLLDHIDVNYGAPTAPGTARGTYGQLSRRYVFTYTTGEFGKTLLASVGRAGKDGTVYATHAFDYYDEVRDAQGNLAGFGGTEDWKTGDSAGANDIPSDVNFNVGALGGSVNDAGDGHVYIGFNPIDPTKTGSFGGSVTVRGGATRGLVEFMDINGDLLPDKVFLQGSTVKVRLNTTKPGQVGPTTFTTDAYTVGNLSSLSTDASVGIAGGPEAYPGFAVQFGISADFSIGEKYFTDVNNDGLVDFVDAGKVKYNHLQNVNGVAVPVFDDQSSSTSVPIDDGTVDTGNLAKLADVEAKQKAMSPLQDMVRRWVAPFDGTVAVTGAVAWDPRSITGAVDDSAPADGVRVAIQRNDAELWSASLTTAGAPAMPSGVGAVKVSKGTKLYFRVQSVDDGARDRVSWNPTVTYTAFDSGPSAPPTDVNGLSQTTFGAADDFTLAGRPGTNIRVPSTGTIHLDAAVTKAAKTTDDVTVLVLHNGTPVFSQKLAADSASATPVPVSTDIQVLGPRQKPGQSDPKVKDTDTLELRLAVDSPIDIAGLSWAPKLYYTAATDEQGNALDVIASDDVRDPTTGILLTPKGGYKYQLQAPYDIDIYPQSTGSAPELPWTSDLGRSVTAHVEVSAAGDRPKGTAYFTVKQRGVLVAKQPLTIAAGPGAATATADVDLSLTNGQDYWYGITTRDPDVSDAITGSSVELRWTDSGKDKSESVPSTRFAAGRQSIFPVSYRGWGYAGYNGDGSRASSPLNQAAFEFKKSDYPTTEPTGWDQSPSSNPLQGDAYALVPGQSVTRNADGSVRSIEPVWRGGKDNLVGAATFASSSRTGADSPGALLAAGNARATRRLSVTAPIFALTLGLGPLGTSFAAGPSFGLLDYLDLNGDSFPDVVAPNQVQYTGPRGGYWADRSGPAVVRQDTTFAVSGGLAGAPIGIKASATGNTTAAAGTSAVSNGKGSPGTGSASHGGEASKDEYGASVGASLGVAATFSNPNTQDLAAGQGFNKINTDTAAPFEQDFADVNGDGLPDRVKAGTGGVTVELNLGYGFAKSIHWADGGFETGGSFSGSIGGTGGFQINNKEFSGGITETESADQTNYAWSDVDGDGVVDRLHKSGDQVLVSFGTNSGLGPETPYGTMASGQVTPFVGGTPAAGDGIQAGQQIGFNRGRGLGGGFDFSIGIGPLCIAACYLIINPGAHFQHSVSATQVSLTDVNGDGYPDSVRSDVDGSMTVRLNTRGRTNLLKTVHNPVGGSFTLGYRRDGNTTAQPYSQWILGDVEVDDGRPGDGPTTTLTTYDYSGNSYNSLERQMLGYSRVVETERSFAADGNVDDDPVLRRTIRDYLNGNVFESGLEASTTVQRPDGTTAQRTSNTWTLLDLATGQPANLAPTSSDPAGVRLLSMAVTPQLTRADQSWYDTAGNQQLSTHTDFRYDDRGLLVYQRDAGQEATPADDTVALTSYSDCRKDPSSPFPWMAIPTAYEVHAAAEDGPLLRRRENVATTICTDGAPTEVQETYATGKTATTKMTFDAWGNYNQVAYPATDGTPTGYTVDYVYDADRHSDIASTTDSHGLTATATYDGPTGLITERVDANHQKTTYDYDAQGRLSWIRAPYEQLAGAKTVSFHYDPTNADYGVATADNYDSQHTGDKIQTATFVDGLGRETQTKQDITYATGTPGGEPRMAVAGAVEYDGLGRVYKEWYPTTEPLGTLTTYNTGTYTQAPPTTTEYDVLDRPTSIALPNGVTLADDYGFADLSGAGTVFAVTRTSSAADATAPGGSALLQTERRLSDVHDNLRELALLPAGAPAMRTRYTYDPLGQLLTVTDAAGKVAGSYEYDLAGHRTSVTTADGGRTDSVYDGAGHLVSQIDPISRAAGTATTYAYDLERLRRIDYPDGRQVSYDYGDAPTASGPVTGNTAGRVTAVTDGARNRTLTYDALGAIASETTTMQVHNLTTDTVADKTFTTSLGYDGFGRLLTVAYPDGEVVTNHYDAGGLLASVDGVKGGITYRYLDRREYDQFLDRRFDQTGDGTLTEYTYDPAARTLARLRTDTKQRKVQDYLYTYDKLGNLRKSVNDLPAPKPSLYGGPSTQTYDYDAYYRYKGGSGTYTFDNNKKRRYSLSLDVDILGNIMRKTQTDDVSNNGRNWLPQKPTTYDLTYRRTNAQPHQITGIGTRSYTYDDAGQFTGWTDSANGTNRSVTWTAAHRVASIADQGSTTRYTYDDTGSLAIQRGPLGERSFVNQWYTVLNGDVVWKDVWADGDRIATQRAYFDGTPEDQRYYLQKNLQRSTSIVTDKDGNVFEHMEYFPGGETWVFEHSDTHRTPYLYAGAYLDETRAAVNMGQRWYDPREETFYSTDPVLVDDPALSQGDPLLLAAYTYADSNPLTLNDTDGRLRTSLRQSLRNDFAKWDFARKANLLAEQLGADPVKDKSKHGGLWRFATSDGAKTWGSLNKKLQQKPLVEFKFEKTAKGWSLSAKIAPLLTGPRIPLRSGQSATSANQAPAAAPAAAAAANASPVTSSTGTGATATAATGGSGAATGPASSVPPPTVAKGATVPSNRNQVGD